ncbi:iron-containing alcohol dehydrogenase [Candidatus Bathyarchaeota archaeon]|nr:iron-containing alcohol dehydrogenase [Candidatus Bathyarchaeota archaeon]RJS81743.1 MAG: iron-containing alcohol dehydrogenase [Candidatus Bathyarchaeota archaeon]
MSETYVEKAKRLLKEFKGDDYAFGEKALEKIGEYSHRVGKKVAIITGRTGRRTGILDQVQESLKREGIEVLDVLDGARPNTPREDVYRLAYQLTRLKCDGAIAIGGGSTLDAAKAALVLYKYGGVIDEYFGTGMVSAKSGGERIPLIAIQTASSSASHLTKYSNITDVVTYQKKLIVDDSIVPRASVFQYDVTKSMPPSFTKDGALDGIAHCWEVWMGATGKSYYERVSEVAYTGIKLIVDALPKALENGEDMEARYALGLGTDLGGYSIMLGGTNGGHLGSFSLVDILPHGRACAILNPYYTVLFAPTIQDQLKKVSKIYAEAGFISESETKLTGRKLAEAVARGMIEFSRSIEFPTTLKEAGATEKHIEKMVKAAKDPQLKMKLQNMPIPMDAEAGDVDRLMKPTLEAAYTGDLSLIPEV